MMVVIAYDVDTTSAAGAKRLRKVARLCEQYGIRVQNSVFEVLVDAAQLAALDAQVYGKRVTPYGVEALVRRDAMPAGAELAPVSIEELFVLMVKGENVQ